MKNVPHVACCNISMVTYKYIINGMLQSFILIAFCSFYGWVAQKSSLLIQYSAPYAHMSGLPWYISAQDGSFCLLSSLLLTVACLQSPEHHYECTL